MAAWRGLSPSCCFCSQRTSLPFASPDSATPCLPRYTLPSSRSSGSPVLLSLLFCQIPSSLLECLLPALCSNRTMHHRPSRPTPLPIIAQHGERRGIWDLRGREVGKLPHGAGGQMSVKSVTSALIRTSGSSARPLLCCTVCTVAALGQEESGTSLDLDSPSAKAKDDCFVGLCLQAGPCSGLGSPVGISETPRRKDDSSPCLCSPGRVSISLSLHSLPPRSC